jgi:hypothetical protein
LNCTKSDGGPDQQRKQTYDLVLPFEVAEELPSSNGKTGFKPSHYGNVVIKIWMMKE